jgi:hypothetical protein
MPKFRDIPGRGYTVDSMSKKVEQNRQLALAQIDRVICVIRPRLIGLLSGSLCKNICLPAQARVVNWKFAVKTS